MAKVGISLKVDVTKIDKARLFRGQKGTYLDMTVFVDLNEADQYGNHGMITQDVSKEERDAGARGEILGNCKVFWREGGSQPAQQDYRGHQGSNQQNPTYGQQQQQQQNQQAHQQNGRADSMDDSIPF